MHINPKNKPKTFKITCANITLIISLRFWMEEIYPLLAKITAACKLKQVKNISVLVRDTKIRWVELD